MKFRQHHGGLAESMATTVELNSKEEFLAYFHQLIESTGYTYGTLSFIQYGFDSRINQDTYLVSLKGYGVLGMLDGPPPINWWPPVAFVKGTE